MIKCTDFSSVCSENEREQEGFYGYLRSVFMPGGSFLALHPGFIQGGS